MYLTYVPGIFSDWNHPRHIVHLTSDDLIHWKFRKVLDLITEKVIDAGVSRMPDGTWRMWYNDEPSGKRIAYADSKDLYEWEDHGLLPGIQACEGPKVFKWKGSWWMICDEWKGFTVHLQQGAVAHHAVVRDHEAHGFLPGRLGGFGGEPFVHFGSVRPDVGGKDCQARERESCECGQESSHYSIIG